MLAPSKTNIEPKPSRSKSAVTDAERRGRGGGGVSSDDDAQGAGSHSEQVASDKEDDVDSTGTTTGLKKVVETHAKVSDDDSADNDAFSAAAAKSARKAQKKAEKKAAKQAKKIAKKAAHKAKKAKAAVAAMKADKATDNASSAAASSSSRGLAAADNNREDDNAAIELKSSTRERKVAADDDNDDAGDDDGGGKHEASAASKKAAAESRGSGSKDSSLEIGDEFGADDFAAGGKKAARTTAAKLKAAKARDVGHDDNESNNGKKASFKGFDSATASADDDDSDGGEDDGKTSVVGKKTAKRASAGAAAAAASGAGAEAKARDVDYVHDNDNPNEESKALSAAPSARPRRSTVIPSRLRGQPEQQDIKPAARGTKRRAVVAGLQGEVALLSLQSSRLWSTPSTLFVLFVFAVWLAESNSLRVSKKRKHRHPTTDADELPASVPEDDDEDDVEMATCWSCNRQAQASNMISCGDDGCANLLCEGGETPCISRKAAKSAAATGVAISCASVPLTPDRHRYGPRRTVTMTTRLLVDDRVRQDVRTKLSTEFRQHYYQHGDNLTMSPMVAFDADAKSSLPAVGAQNCVVVLAHAFLAASDGRNFAVQGRPVTVTDFCKTLFCGNGGGGGGGSLGKDSLPRVIVVMACGIQPNHLSPLRDFCAEHNDGKTSVVVCVRTNAGAGDVQGLAPKRLVHTVANALGVHFAYTGISVAAALELFSTADSRNHADLHVVTATDITVVGHGSIIAGTSAGSGGVATGKSEDVKASLPPLSSPALAVPSAQQAKPAGVGFQTKTLKAAQSQLDSESPMDTTPFDQADAPAAPSGGGGGGAGARATEAKSNARTSPPATSAHHFVPAHGQPSISGPATLGYAPSFQLTVQQPWYGGSVWHPVFAPPPQPPTGSYFATSYVYSAAPPPPVMAFHAVARSLPGRMPLCSTCGVGLKYQSKDLQAGMTRFCCRKQGCPANRRDVWLPSA
jgi:hypothetical protein